PGRPAQRHQAGQAGSPPVVRLASALLILEELHDRAVFHVLARAVRFPENKRINSRHFRCDRTDSLERKKRMLEMIKHAHEQYDVESPDCFRGYVINVQLAILDVGTQRRSHLMESLVVPGVNCQNIRSAALHFKAVPAIPGADIEYPHSPEILR